MRCGRGKFAKVNRTEGGQRPETTYSNRARLRTNITKLDIRYTSSIVTLKGVQT